MLQKGAARKVTIFVNEDTQHHFAPLADSILTFLLHKGVAGATATRAMAGFGAHRALHAANMEARAEHLPIRIEFIESPARVDELLPALYDMVNDGLIEVQDTQVIKAVAKEAPAEPAPPRVELRGAARLMRIYLGESDRWHGQPLYEAIVQRLRMLDIAGATVYRGVLGYGAKGHTHKSGILPFSRDLPIMISVVDSQERLDRALAEIEPMMPDALIVLSDVDVVRLVRHANL
jgi:PII-like signaling protein